jgi:hypothetical protein
MQVQVHAVTSEAEARAAVLSGTHLTAGHGRT